MPFLNVEIKARCADPVHVRDYLVAHHAICLGVDEQTDTYFQVPEGRLKLREGQIENNLIFYKRPDQAGPKHSDFHLAGVNDPASLKALLSAALGIKMTVIKKREIYFIENVKFHIDEVPGLGSFIEIEAGNIHANLSHQELQEQCEFYINELGIKSGDLVEFSYSDMLAGANQVI